MSGLTSVHPRLSAATVSRSYWPSGVSFVARLWRDLFKDFRSSYRPELHYMRGPGPHWREKHGAVLTHDGGIPDVGHATEMNRRAAAQCPERRAIARRTTRETQTLAAVDLEHGHTQARQIVEARRDLIAELEQRRRLPVALRHELSEVA